MSTEIKTSVTMGKPYTDNVTGFVGKAIAITKWQYGCIRIALRPAVNKDGEMQEEEWFDEQSLIGVKQKQRITGGPSPNPRRERDPKL